jgi:peptidoglycan/xylan/chitin deacetylase (PgdA/CDA1 family)
VVGFFIVWTKTPGTKAMGRRLALTIDDVPYESSASLGIKIVRRVNEILRGAGGIKVVAFAIASRVSPATKSQLDFLLEGGHGIGNHSFAHRPLHSISLGEFQRDIISADETLKSWMGVDRYYRYPLLQTGNSRWKRDGARRTLSGRGYTPVWATVDPPDYSWYETTAATSVAGWHIRRCVETVLLWCEHYDALAQRLMRRRVDHVLALHLSPLLPALLEQLLPVLVQNGWEYISIREALEDPIYALSDRRVGLSGVSWVHQVRPDTSHNRPDEALT